NTFKNREGFGFKEESTETQAGFERILSLWEDTATERDESIDQREQLKGSYLYDCPETIAEEDYVANIVEDILENHFIVEKFREDNKDYNISRPIEPKDIMILTKSNAETGEYLKALKEKNIQALLAGEKRLGDTREVLNLFILVDGLLDYRDDIKLVSALRNSFYLELDTIDLFMEDNKNLSIFLFDDRELNNIPHPSLRSALKCMKQASDLMRSLGPISFLESLIKNKFGLYNMGKEYSQSEKYDADSALRQTMEIIKSEGCTSIYEVRNTLEKLVDNKVNYELPL